MNWKKRFFGRGDLAKAGRGKGDFAGAYMTVEAALVMPFAMFCILFVMYVGFLQYDRCLVQQDAQIAILRASNEKTASEGQLRTYLSDMLRSRKEEGKYPFLSALNVEEKAAGGEVGLRWEGWIATALPDTGAGMSMNSREEAGVLYSALSFVGEQSTERYRPVELIRICRKVESYLGDGISE